MKLDDKFWAHYLNLDFSDDFLSDNSSDFYIQLPYPIHKPFKNTEIDVINKLNEDLNTYNKQLSTLAKDFSLVKDRVLNQSFSNQHATITKGLLNFCNREKPEAVFACDYNPYYGVGLLDHFCLNGTDYLVRPDSVNNLCITNIVNPWISGKLKVNYKIEENVTGISSCTDSATVFLLLKHKNDVNLLKISDINDVAQVVWRKRFKRDVVFTKCNKTKIGVITSSTKLQIYDITASKTDFTVDKFNNNSATHFEFINDSTISILSQKNFVIIDLRSNDRKLFQPDLQNCNYLCSVKIDDNVVYLGSRHHLIRTDIRFSKSVEFCTHLMKYSPCYMELVDNFLCLSSQKEEKVLFSGKPIDSLPLSVPNLHDTLNKCKLHKNILLKDNVQDRLEKSVGGIKLITASNGVFLYTVNTLGDVFKQRITNNLQPDENDAVESLHEWINNLPIISKPLHLTNVANLSNARFALNKRIEPKIKSKFNTRTGKANQFLTRYKNTYHKNNLGELAANFASIWEDEEEREDVDIVPEVAPLDKVSSWIETNTYYFD